MGWFFFLGFENRINNRSIIVSIMELSSLDDCHNNQGVELKMNVRHL
jgi:hypothetical protein